MTGQWEVTFQTQGCIDDGGIGHDSYWSTPVRQVLQTKATTDEGALKAARRWVAARNRAATPCGSFACDNQRRTRLVSVEHVVPELRRSIS